MLVLSAIHKYLSQILCQDLHTALLLNPEGSLVSVAANPQRPKDQIRIVAALSAEVWQETRGQAFGMVESEVLAPCIAGDSCLTIMRPLSKLGRILVIAIENEVPPENRDPLLLLALNATPSVEWEVLQMKGKKMARYLAPSVNKYREQFEASKAPSNTPSPNRSAR
ncbi:hypothetical protein SERLA73DRAFT_68906 [Serpula lacrymans var. lacrymans S7.3]|uniref:Roadblock/LAMTOR2 domain-containing protein n=2 Tax=Serpula lacrymans var. lacrymans TaxID=341189 RepID=F8PFI8_SERL3|nr:uncharacterized protein SERLADRAFT_432790 [Serpula lacrymans var. lacrymans S7.9]EGO05277.1 hypothetical protein SERLA73DRAFT_68906 [Serpula lacrymans var. lacrymans S7.3]EGO31133.1 hypothetical protein SERLADRAFT_432790 [Serpula lacrymans var. lacrymans S7.9]